MCTDKLFCSFSSHDFELGGSKLVNVNWSGLSLFPFHTPASIHIPLSWTSQKADQGKRRCKAYYYHLLFSFYEAVNTYQPDKIENISGNYQTPLLLYLILIFFSSSLLPPFYVFIVVAVPTYCLFLVLKVMHYEDFTQYTEG